MLSLALGALALGAGASRATADEVYKGTFTLSSPAYWGDTLLQPGEYTIMMHTDLTRTPFVRLRGAGVNAVIMGIPVSSEPVSGRSSLMLGGFNGGYAVQKLDAGPLGRTFHFAVSKRVRNGTERAAAGTPVHVPVSAGGF
jgi:hypothetical protein